MFASPGALNVSLRKTPLAHNISRKMSCVTVPQIICVMRQVEIFYCTQPMMEGFGFKAELTLLPEAALRRLWLSHSVPRVIHNLDNSSMLEPPSNKFDGWRMCQGGYMAARETAVSVGVCWSASVVYLASVSLPPT